MPERIRRQEGGLGLPEPHSPTTRELHLGLGLAAMGMADITPAKDYVTRSGCYRLLPGNREERRRWHNASSKTKLPEEFSAIERRRLERFREFGHEGIPTCHHAAWIDPAASALLARAIDWVIQEGLSSRALDAFELLDWLYGAGRQPPTEFFDLTSNAIRRCAQLGDMNAVAFLMEQKVKYELPYWRAALGELSDLASQAVYGDIESRAACKRESFAASDMLVEAILAFPFGELEVIADEGEYEEFERRKREKACSVYYWRERDARECNMEDLAENYNQKSLALGRDQ